jgi:glycosyltransferase involved in cell wall biosynthesis
MARNAYWNRIEARSDKYVYIQNGIQRLERVDRKQKDRIQIGTLSRLAPERTPELFLKFFSELSKISPKIDFVIGGEGPEKNQLIKLAHDLGMSRNIFFSGAIENVPKFYDELDYYVALNVGPTTGIAGLEAISSGLPTIAIQLNRNYESGEFDWIASFLSPLKASEFLSQLIGNRDTLLNYVRMQELEFQNNFTSDIMASKYLNLYENL